MKIPDGIRPGVGAVVLTVVWVASAVYAAGFVRRGWIPLDEGTTALSAERVLHGQLVHRDFEGAYTGGLSHLHALAFELFGTNLLSLRLALFVFFLAFVPAVFLSARRFFGPMAAAAVTLCAVAWSVPNYFAGMPSWYNLFFALFGTLAALRFVRTRGRVWLFVAGLCAGLSILAKITGLYFVAALLLFAVHAVQTDPGPVAAPERRPRLFTVFLAACGACLVALLLLLVQRRSAPMELLQFVAPAAVLCGYLVWYEATAGRGSSGARFRSLFSLVWPAAAGLLLPIAVFLVPYAASGSLGSVVAGLAGNTTRQLENTKSMMYLPPLDTFWSAIPYLLLLVSPTLWPRRLRALGIAALAAVLAAILLATGRTDVYRLVWHSAQPLAAVAVLAGCRFLFRARETEVPAGRRLEIFLLLCVAAMISLVQFPFAAAIYFCYAAPVVILALAALVASDTLAPRAVHGVVLAFYLGFALWRMNPAYVFTLGHHPEIYRADHRLSLPRGGLLVPEQDGRIYEELVEAIRSVDRGTVLFAAPDCPEVYFLAGRESPLFVFVDFQGPLYERHQALLNLIQERGIRTVVINRRPTFSRRLRPDFLAELEKRFPRSRAIGPFELRWADAAGPPSL